MNQTDKQKKIAAEKAVEQIESGMIVGLGTGSTALFAIKRIAELLESGKLNNIVGIPTSLATEDEALKAGIRVGLLDEFPEIDITIDGADEVDRNLYLIKGGGGALLKEKIIAQASERVIIVVDESKLSNQLGEKWALPVEVVPMALEVEKRFLKTIGGSPMVRERRGGYFVTDEGNYIIDASFGVIKDPENLASKLHERAGIVEHGLFLNIASQVIVAGKNGIKILDH